MKNEKVIQNVRVRLEAEAVGRGRRVMDNIDNIGFLLIVLFLFFVMLTNLIFR